MFHEGSQFSTLFSGKFANLADSASATSFR